MTDNLKQEAKTLADWANLAIAKHFKKTIKHETEVLKDKDPEELHQMRVGMRRLRSTIVGFSRALALPKAANEKKVGKVARILGELRDIDVLDEALKTQYQPLLPNDEQKALDTALKELSQKRKKSFQKVKEILNGDSYLNLKFAFRQWVEHPIYQDMGHLEIHTVLSDLLLPQVSNFLLHPAWLVGVSDRHGNINLEKTWTRKEVEDILLHEQGEMLHDLRKEAKRTRYNMELFTQFYGDAYQGYLEDVKAIQSVLGEMQDCFVLGHFLTEVFGKDIEKEIPTVIDKFQEIRYQKWNEWQVLQRKFLNPQTRKEFHIAILGSSLAQSALESVLK